MTASTFILLIIAIALGYPAGKALDRMVIRFEIGNAIKRTRWLHRDASLPDEAQSS